MIEVTDPLANPASRFLCSSCTKYSILLRKLSHTARYLTNSGTQHRETRDTVTPLESQIVTRRKYASLIPIYCNRRLAFCFMTRVSSADSVLNSSSNTDLKPIRVVEKLLCVSTRIAARISHANTPLGGTLSVNCFAHLPSSTQGSSSEHTQNQTETEATADLTDSVLWDSSQLIFGSAIQRETRSPLSRGLLANQRFPK